VEELETEQVVEILDEVADVRVENLKQVSEDVIEVVAKVVEKAVEEIEELNDEQKEVVGEVLGFDEETAKEDVEIIAEQAKEDEVIAEAVEVFVERAVENADDTILPYTLADVVVEIQFEEFVADPIGAIIDIDLQDIKISEIGADLTTDQKEKAQEVIVPTILVRVASLALLRREV
jgi:Lhr-like helicase